VERLSGLDAFFLYIETPTMHTHVVLTAVLDPATMPDGYSFEAIRRHVADRVHLVRPFRKRLVEVPFRVHHPVWVDDADFDIDRHLKRIGVPAPGGLRELSTVVGQIASVQLERSKPLWELWIIEGLEGGRFALVAKVHHSAMDGASGIELLPAFFDLERQPANPITPPVFEPAPAPDEWSLLGSSAVDRVRSLRSLPSLMRGTARSITAIRRERRTTHTAAGTPLTAPATVFNGPITAERTVGFARISLPKVKEVKNAFGATVNDVILATCALAMRNFLSKHGALPDQPLVTACPVSVRADDERGQFNNRLSVMFTKLHTDIEDPVACLLATQKTAAAAKQEHEVLGSETLGAWAELADPLAARLASSIYSSNGLASRHRPALSFILSNVPGPPFPVYLAGAEMERAYPMGPVLEGAGLNVTMLSYRDSVDFGFLGATELVPDIWALADAVPEAFDELHAAAVGTRDARRAGSTEDALVERDPVGTAVPAEPPAS
jgi:WS/DGAT/MGAT family acyltransferase